MHRLLPHHEAAESPAPAFSLTAISRLTGRLTRRIEAARQALHWSLTAYEGKHFLHRMKQHLRWPILAALQPDQALLWFRTIRNIHLQASLASYPYLALKPFRPYQSTGWTFAERINSIAGTYPKLGMEAPHWLDAVNQRGYHTLTTLQCRQQQFDIRLCRDHRFRKEGELIITIHRQRSSPWIMAIAFSLMHSRHGEWRCHIGAIQGNSGTLAALKDMTKEMYGLRPRNLLIGVVQTIATHLGVRKIMGIGNAIHPHAKKHLLPGLSGKEMHFDYDATWIEVGGVMQKDGWYALPAHFPRKSRDEIPSRKRAEYRRRHDLLDTLLTDIHLAFAQRPRVGLSLSPGAQTGCANFRVMHDEEAGHHHAERVWKG